MSLTIRPTRNREKLERFFLQRPETHIYALADLEDPFWSHVEAFVAEDAGQIVAAAFFFDRLSIPILYCIAEPGDEAAFFLIKAIAEKVPSPCFGHLGLGLADAVDREFQSVGTMVKMQLTRPIPPKQNPGFTVEPLTAVHEQELSAFYEASAYREGDLGGGFFDPYMLEIGPYFGVRDDGRLVAAGGIHVRASCYRAAALGNIATTPEFRGRGFGTAITSAICETLREETEIIGLNVHSQNKIAQSCYERLGFERVLEYEEGNFV